MEPAHNADLERLAAELREQAERIDMPPEVRMDYTPNNRREADVARHYRAWGLRAAAQVLEDRAALNDGSVSPGTGN